MNRHCIAILSMMTSMLSATAYAATGEYWEVTSKMEMPGMPFAMPATTVKVCIAKGGESDPRKSSGDKDCKMTDIKTVANTTTWKARCERDGEVMTGSGEQTTTANGYKGKVQFSGKSGGRDMNMTTAFSGKRIGGSCDPEEMGKKMKADQQKMLAKTCDTSDNDSTADWIQNSSAFVQQGMEEICPAQRKELCERVRRDAPKDVDTYTALADYELQAKRISQQSMVKACKVDMAAATKSICKKVDEDNYRKLSATCPAEAKRLREIQRRKHCEGREYTAETRAEDLKRCLSGKDDDSGNEEDDSASQDNQSSSKKSGNSSSNPTADMLEGAKKLKGMFGF